MQLSWEHFAGGIGLVFVALFAWFAGVWLHLQGANLVILRVGLVLVGLLLVGAIIWWSRTRAKQKNPSAPNSSAGAPTAEDGGASAGADDILRILREAEARVASSARLGKSTKLSSLPIIFLVGESGAGKTSVAMQSGLEPELLAGQIYQEGAIAPTRLANLWFARKTVFVEVGGKLLNESRLWTRLTQRLSPGRLRSIFRGSTESARAAIVCFDCEKLTKASAPEQIAASSRGLRARLEQISQTLGISFPVYVLFTRADRIPFFDEFFGNLSNDEATQVLGVTLPPLPASTTGVYAEQETKRLTAAFNSMCFSLADCRPGLLYREHAAEKLPGIYEFPRQFRKLSTFITQFLVDICRPSHLRFGPFLRGFYFTGIRTIEAAAPMGGTMIATKTSIAPAPLNFSSNATSILRMDELQQQTKGWESGTQTPRASEGRKTTQWLFLSHILSHVILQDNAALGASGASSKANVWRRALLASAAVLAGIWAIGLIVSFFGNRLLERDVLSVERQIAPLRSPGADSPPLHDLQQLETARLVLDKLTGYERNGAPWHLRWGLYSGEGLRAALRQLYFSRFNDILFRGVQRGMVDSLDKLTGTPGRGEDTNAYETLKAYLMTTSFPQKTTREFLSPVLEKRWEAGRDVGDDRRSLAQLQFDFYASELPIENPLPTPPEEHTVGQARQFLNRASGAQAVYQAMLNEANKGASPFDFNKKHSDGVDVVRDSKLVDGAFTKAGWALMDSAFNHPDRYLRGEDWVLGPSGNGRINVSVVTTEVRPLYQADYIKTWREFLKAGQVFYGGTYPERARKLAKLSGNRSPLLLLLCEVSENTDVPDVRTAFQAIREVVAAPCLQGVKQPPNEAYLAALNKLETCLDGILPALPQDQRDAAVLHCNELSRDARTAAGQIIRTIDRDANVDQTALALLVRPTESLTTPAPTAGGVKEFCGALQSLSSKYPFDPEATQEAALNDLNVLFQPGSGAISKFIDSNKDDFKDGAYAPRAGIKISQSFITVVKQAVDIQRALYPPGTIQTQFKFKVKIQLPEGRTGEKLLIDGESFTHLMGTQNSHEFVWPGKTHEAILSLSTGGPYERVGNYQGPWAVFKLFKDYTWSAAPTGGFHLQSPLLGPDRHPIDIEGRPVQIQFDLDMGNVPLFERGYLKKLKCPR